jgi:hypothetical protein
MNPIAAYLDELSGLLRRRRRRRILAEVRAHLLDAVAADSLCAADPDGAEHRAVERFGPPTRVASQFNALRWRWWAIAHRTAAVILASAATATVGTATVWALEPGGASARTHQHQVRPTPGGAQRLPTRSGARGLPARGGGHR